MRLDNFLIVTCPRLKLIVEGMEYWINSTPNIRKELEDFTGNNPASIDSTLPYGLGPLIKLDPEQPMKRKHGETGDPILNTNLAGIHKVVRSRIDDTIIDNYIGLPEQIIWMLTNFSMKWNGLFYFENLGFQIATIILHEYGHHLRMLNRVGVAYNFFKGHDADNPALNTGTLTKKEYYETPEEKYVYRFIERAIGLKPEYTQQELSYAARIHIAKFKEFKKSLEDDKAADDKMWKDWRNGGQTPLGY